MQKFIISWVIEVEADSIKEAVSFAKEIQLDPQSEANYFIVEDKNGDITNVELMYKEDKKTNH